MRNPKARLVVLLTAVAVALAAATPSTAAVVLHEVLPEIADPDITQAFEEHLAAIDTSAPPSGQLFVFLAGTGGLPRHYRLILQEGARSGFPSIGLRYPNEVAVGDLCSASFDADCYARIRQEMLTGEDVSPLVSIGPADSIENRLTKLLLELDRTYPGEGWGGFLLEGRPAWSRIRVAGHSQGGGHAAFIAKDHEVAGVGCFASPPDWNVRLSRPAAWLEAPHVTPASRYYGFTHERDEVVLFSRTLAAWEKLGMGAAGPPVAVDGASPPYGGSHQLSTRLPLSTLLGATYHVMTVVDVYTPLDPSLQPIYAPVWRTVCFGTPPPSVSSWLLPSSAHAAGSGGSFFTTALTIANPGTADASVTLKFLSHDVDGRNGAQREMTVAAGTTVTREDLLGTVFGITDGWGAVSVTSPSDSLVVVSQTSTAATHGGTFGQSVPAFASGDLILPGVPRTIPSLRENGAFRSNLVLANPTLQAVDVDLVLHGANGALLGSGRISLAPLAMTQLPSALRRLGVAGDIGDVESAWLTLSTATPGGAFAAYASAIDNATNDPRTLLPADRPGIPFAGAAAWAWLLPAAARLPGVGGAFWTTDLTAVNTGTAVAAVTLKFLGHDTDGRTGPEKAYLLGAGTSATLVDILQSVFGQDEGYGAVLVTSTSPSLALLAETSTGGEAGSFGQSLPLFGNGDLVLEGSFRTLAPIREDGAFRTNLILASASEAPCDIDLRLFAEGGSLLGSRRVPLPPLGMTQLSRVARQLGVATDLRSARLAVSVATPGCRVAATASGIDEATNDPRTLLPR